MDQPPFGHPGQSAGQPYSGQPFPQYGKPRQGQSRSAPAQQLQQPQYQYGQPQQNYPYGSMQPPLQPVSTRGPKILTFVGGGILAIAIISLVFAIIGFVSLLPTGVVDNEGKPGPDAVLSIENLERASVDSAGGVSYALWEVTYGNGDDPVLSRSAVEVTGPGGDAVLVRSPSVSSNLNVQGVRTQTLAEFSASEPGAYLIIITPSAGANVDNLARVIVTEAAEFEGFFASIFGTTMLMVVGIGVGIMGFVLTLAGIIWWVMARNRNKRLLA